MTDGDDATAGPAGTPEDADPWGHRAPAAGRTPAPWERFPAPVKPAPVETAFDDSVAVSNPDAPDPIPAYGSHTDGIAVADLIARVTGEPRPEPVAPEPEPRPEPPPDLDALHGLAPPAYASATGFDDPEAPTEAIQVSAGPDPVPAPAAAPIGAAKPAKPAKRRRIKAARAAKPGKPQRKRKRPLMLAGRSLAALFAVLALVLTGSAWQWNASKNQLLNKVAALDPDSHDILDPNAQFGDENFLIVGVDSRYGENAGMGAGDIEDAGGQRSDSIILVNIPANRKRVVAVSFPRDLAITPIQCQAWDPSTGEYGPVYDEESGTYSPEYRTIETKINSAYAYGGPKCLVKVIQKISGLSINRFIAIDFAGFAKMVDAVGGVDVCTPTPLNDYELGTILAHAGHQRIDGHTALNYVRARQVTTEVNGDYGRIKRQQLFLSSLLRSLISSETFFSVKKLNNVVNTFIADSYVDNVDTKDLVDLGQSVQGIAAGRITFVTLPTTGYVDEDGNEEPYTGAIRALFDAIINDDPLPGENDKNETTTPITSSTEATTAAGSDTTATAATPTTEAQEPQETTEVLAAQTGDPTEISVHVSNATERIGLGAAVSEKLESDGFIVDAPDDHPEALEGTTVRYSPGNEQAAVTVAATLGNPRVERVTGLGQEVRVILGDDFESVGLALPPGSPVEVHITRRAPAATTADLPDGLELTNAADASCE